MAMKLVPGFLLTVFTVLALPPATAAYRPCSPGERYCPIEVSMARGTDTVTIEGVTSPGTGCCAYALRARAGQTLSWTLEGPTSRVLLTDPQGNVDGPGLPQSIPLPANGIYVFEVRPNLMADDAHGRFRLTITIR
jgi:hypothetical protein